METQETRRALTNITSFKRSASADLQNLGISNKSYMDMAELRAKRFSDSTSFRHHENEFMSAYSKSMLPVTSSLRQMNNIYSNLNILAKQASLRRNVTKSDDLECESESTNPFEAYDLVEGMLIKIFS